MVIYFFIAIIISGLVLKFTTFGRNVCAVGGNPDVARYTGLKVNWYIITTFVMTSMVASFSGILISSRLNSSSPSFGSDAALQIISGVVLGGNSLNGGQGSAVKTFSGMMILALVSNALNMMNVYSYIQTLIKGLLLVAIVAADRFYQNRIK
jgi:ribose transport system permease protein